MGQRRILSLIIIIIPSSTGKTRKAPFYNRSYIITLGGMQDFLHFKMITVIVIPVKWQWHYLLGMCLPC